MKPHTIDLTKPKAVVEEIFDDDRWVKDEFSKHLSSEILQFADALANSFKKFPQLDALAEDDEQAAFVTSFIHGIFDDLLTSTKLLVTGKLMASGNLMRQAIEGVAVALLCSSRELIHVPAGKHKVDRIRYWKHVKQDHPLVASHKALHQLEMNCGILGISREAIAELKKARSEYHQFSHPGLMGIASRVALGEPGPIFVGGGFDDAKLPTYKHEIEARTGFCRTLPNLIDILMARLSKGLNGANPD